VDELMSDVFGQDLGVEVLAVTPRIAKRMLGCGTTRLYDLLNRGELESYRDGKARRIIVASLRDYVSRRLAAERCKVKPVWTDRATSARMAKRLAKAKAP
jgi:excisionase family DNA binding protein